MKEKQPIYVTENNNEIPRATLNYSRSNQGLILENIDVSCSGQTKEIAVEGVSQLLNLLGQVRDNKLLPTEEEDTEEPGKEVG